MKLLNDIVIITNESEEYLEYPWVINPYSVTASTVNYLPKDNNDYIVQGVIDIDTNRDYGGRYKDLRIQNREVDRYNYDLYDNDYLTKTLRRFKMFTSIIPKNRNLVLSRYIADPSYGDGYKIYSLDIYRYKRIT